ncbi:MAG: efflux RND transporter periplasmic adaptor subunit, partial [Polymorphobacter sp.]
GSIAARRDMPVGVQGEGGRVTAVLVDAGQFVGAGQVLARIDSAVQAQQLVQMQAGVRSARADAALAQAELDRAQTLVGKGFISKADIDRKTAARDAAQARVAVAVAQASEMQARLGRLDVRAPAAGLVLARSVEAGQVVGAGSPALFRIAEGGTLELRAAVTEQDMERLKVGMPAQVRPLGATSSYQGKVWLLDPVIDSVSRQGVARIALPYSPGLRVGAFATADISAGETTQPVLPQSAVQVDGEGSYVLIVGTDDIVVRRTITTGTVSDAGVSIATGLTGRERVVLNAAAFLRPGEKVQPVPAPKR